MFTSLRKVVTALIVPPAKLSSSKSHKRRPRRLGSESLENRWTMSASSLAAIAAVHDTAHTVTVAAAVSGQQASSKAEHGSEDARHSGEASELRKGRDDRPAETDTRGRGADDPASHDVGDDHGRRHGGHGADDVVVAAATSAAVRGGADDSASHDVADDKGRRRGGHGADDPANHDVGDDHGRRHGGHGADDVVATTGAASVTAAAKAVDQRQEDRQADRQENRQADRQEDRRADRQANRRRGG